MMWRCKDRGWDEMAPCLVEEVLVCEAQYEVHLPPSASQPRNPPYLFIKNKIEKKKSGHSGAASVNPKVRPHDIHRTESAHSSNIILPSKIDNFKDYRASES